MKKLLVVGVIVLFLGLAIAPSVNANMSEIQEYQYEDCGCISESDSNVELQDKYPVICSLLYLLFLPVWLITLALSVDFIYLLFGLPIVFLAMALGCSWAYIHLNLKSKE